MSLRVGIVGAGIAGLTLAHRLAEAGHLPLVLDKGRGVGGRASSRRAEGSDARFDHGAQYFTARDEGFRAFLARHVPPGHLAPWEGRFARLEAGRVVPEVPGEPWLVGVPGMNAVARALAGPFEVRTAARVVALAGSSGAWTLEDDQGRRHEALDWVVSTAPPAQTSALLGKLSPIADEARGVAMRPCFALMLEPADGATLPADGVRCDGHPVLGWAANNHSKPGRGPSPALVLHSSADWAEAHLGDDHASVARALREAASEAFGVDLNRVGSEAVQRWLYARPGEPLGRPCLVDASARLAACGDWCVAPRLEAAYLSGHACAQTLLGAATV